MNKLLLIMLSSLMAIKTPLFSGATTQSKKKISKKKGSKGSQKKRKKSSGTTTLNKMIMENSPKAPTDQKQNDLKKNEENEQIIKYTTIKKETITYIDELEKSIRADNTNNQFPKTAGEDLLKDIKTLKEEINKITEAQLLQNNLNNFFETTSSSSNFFTQWQKDINTKIENIKKEISNKKNDIKTLNEKYFTDIQKPLELAREEQNKYSNTIKDLKDTFNKKDLEAKTELKKLENLLNKYTNIDQFMKKKKEETEKVYKQIKKEEKEETNKSKIKETSILEKQSYNFETNKKTLLLNDDDLTSLNAEIKKNEEIYTNKFNTAEDINLLKEINKDNPTAQEIINIEKKLDDLNNETPLQNKDEEIKRTEKNQLLNNIYQKKKLLSQSKEKIKKSKYELTKKTTKKNSKTNADKIIKQQASSGFDRKQLEADILNITTINEKNLLTTIEGISAPYELLTQSFKKKLREAIKKHVIDTPDIAENDLNNSIKKNKKLKKMFENSIILFVLLEIENEVVIKIKKTVFEKGKNNEIELTRFPLSSHSIEVSDLTLLKQALELFLKHYSNAIASTIIINIFEEPIKKMISKIEECINNNKTKTDNLENLTTKDFTELKTKITANLTKETTLKITDFKNK